MTVTRVLSGAVQPEGQASTQGRGAATLGGAAPRAAWAASRSPPARPAAASAASSSSSSSSWSCSSRAAALLGGGDGGSGTDTATDRYNECQTGADANENADCARALVEDSLVAYWEDNARAADRHRVLRDRDRHLHRRRVHRAAAATPTSAVGPFYCPVDKTIYLDSTFFEDVLEGQLGGQGGDFVEPYVLAHEYGHHIQNLLGTMGQVKTQQGPTSDAVRLELQADCYAGMWTQGALNTTDDRA